MSEQVKKQDTKPCEELNGLKEVQEYVCELGTTVATMDGDLEELNAKVEDLDAEVEELSKAVEDVPDWVKNATLHCFKLSKVYDWVRLRSQSDFTFKVPDADIKAITDAVNAGHEIIITSTIPVDETKATVIFIERKYEETNPLCACVGFQKILHVYIKIYDNTTNTVLSSFDKTIQLFDSAKMCIPKDFDKSSISVKIIGAEALPLSTLPVDGFIIIQISTCQDIEALLEVHVNLPMAGFCLSRQGEPCRGSVECKFGEGVTYPEQCSREKNCNL